MNLPKINIKKATVSVVFILGLSGQTLAAQASAPNFSFFSVEYTPLDQRIPAANAFLAAHAAPGDDVQAAVTAIRHAGAYCRPEHEVGASIQCSLTADRHKTGEHVDEVIWRVQIDQTPAGKVARANASRDVVGF